MKIRLTESRPEFQVNLQNLENQVVWKYMKLLCPKSKQLDGCYRGNVQSPNLWVNKLFHVFKFSLSLDPTSAINPILTYKSVSPRCPKRSLAFCPTCLCEAWTVEVEHEFRTVNRSQMMQDFVQEKVLSKIDLVGSFVPFHFQFSVLMSSKTWTTASHYIYVYIYIDWYWTFLLETWFSWFLGLGLRKFWIASSTW